MRRKPDLTREAFADYWRVVHAPVAMSFTILPSSYVQHVAVETIAGKPFDFDGVMVMHFLDAENRRSRWEDHPDEAARGLRDAQQFMDMNTTAGSVMIETIWR